MKILNFLSVCSKKLLKPRLGSIKYESTFDHCKTVISDWLTRSVKIISKDVSENVSELFRKVDTLSILWFSNWQYRTEYWDLELFNFRIR